MKRLIVVAIAVFLMARISQAQEAPRVDVAVGYSPLYILKGYTIWMNGGSGSAAVNVNHWLGLVGDLGVYHGYPSESLTGETYMFGPRFSSRKRERFVPFAQALFGGSHFSASSGGITAGGNEFAFSLGGGADFALDSNARFALRPQFEYVGIRSGGSTTPAARVGVGIVYRFGNR